MTITLMLPCTHLRNRLEEKTRTGPASLTNSGACRMHRVFQQTLLHQTLYIGDLMRNWCSRRAYLQFILTLWLGTVKENGAETVAEGSTRGKWGQVLRGWDKNPPRISRAFSILSGQCHLEPVVPFALDLHRIIKMILNEEIGTAAFGCWWEMWMNTNS